jgi:hypothetical protein
MRGDRHCRERRDDECEEPSHLNADAAQDNTGAIIVLMESTDPAVALGRLFSELVDGVTGSTGFALNTGDVGLLKSLDKLSAADASRSTNGGATIAAHLAYHLGAIRQIHRDSRGPTEGTF